jgi:hypothetical protein
MAPYFEVRPEEEEFLGYAIGVKVCPFAMVMVFLPVLFQPQGRKGTRCPFFVLPFFFTQQIKERLSPTSACVVC